MKQRVKGEFSQVTYEGRTVVDTARLVRSRPDVLDAVENLRVRDAKTIAEVLRKQDRYLGSMVGLIRKQAEMLANAPKRDKRTTGRKGMAK